ncbi:MAG: hypothetical protein ACKO1G_01910 [Microcystis aeruginosa]
MYNTLQSNDMGQLSLFYLGAIARTFLYITPKSVLARLAHIAL